jgi:transcriptional regulator with XRE-family HTH domain
MAKPRKRLMLSEQLRKAVEDSGFTVYRLAKDVGLDPRIIYRFMRGEHVTTATADLIAERLGLRLTDKP